MHNGKHLSVFRIRLLGAIMGEDFDELSIDELWALTTEGNETETRAKALIEIAVRARRESNFQDALSAAQAAGDLYAQLDETLEVGRSSYFAGTLCNQLERYEDALEALDRAIEIYRVNATEIMLADAIRAKADALMFLDRLDEAYAERVSAVALYESNEAYTPAGIVSLDLGEAFGRAGAQTKALEHFKEAFRIFQLGGDLIGAGRAHDRIAAALIDLGNLSEAISHLRDALAIFQYIEDESRLTYSKYRLGWTLVTFGENEEALIWLEQAVAEHKANRRFTQAAQADVQRAHAMGSMGRNDEALAIYRAVRAVFEGAGEHEDAYITDVNIAAKLMEAGDLFSAEESLHRAIRGAAELEDEWLDRAARVRLAELYFQREQFDSALSTIALSDPEAWGENLEQKTRHLNIQARVLSALGRDEEALPLVERVIDLGLAQGHLAESASAYEQLANIWRGSNKPEVDQVVAQSIALYLAAGFDEKARELSKLLMPGESNPAAQILRREESQPSIGDGEDHPE